MLNRTSRHTARLAVAGIASVAALTLAMNPAIAGITSLFDKPAPAGFRNVSGPNTLVPPYVVGSSNAVTVQSLLTTGDAGVLGYGMAGIPDALSTWKVSDRTAMLLMNHELGSDKGIVRAHGQKGSFVSRWFIDRAGKIISGGDLITSVKYWTGSAWANTPSGTDPAAFNRFCSGSLALPLQLRDTASGTGITDPLYFANEEAGDNSRVFGVNVTTGEAVELPALGRASWENVLLATNTGRKTVTIANEDGAVNASQVWVYSGTKGKTGTFVERAGLTGGSTFVMRVNDGNGDRVATDTAFRSAYARGQAAPFTLVSIDTTKTGTEQNVQAGNVGTGLSRVEDGMFDPNNPNVYYFITTAGGTNNSAGLSSGGLWKMVFNDIKNPEAGGTITLLLDNTSLPRYNGGTGLAMNMPDNLVVDKAGNILIQEDPGNNAVISRIFAYRISDGAFAEVARFDANRFTPGVPQFITQDEESSGIIDASDLLGAGTYLFDAQVHSSKELAAGTGKGTVEELVEGGQLLRMTISDWSAIFGS